MDEPSREKNRFTTIPEGAAFINIDEYPEPALPAATVPLIKLEDVGSDRATAVEPKETVSNAATVGAPMDLDPLLQPSLPPLPVPTPVGPVANRTPTTGVPDPGGDDLNDALPGKKRVQFGDMAPKEYKARLHNANRAFAAILRNKQAAKAEQAAVSSKASAGPPSATGGSNQAAPSRVKKITSSSGGDAKDRTYSPRQAAPRTGTGPRKTKQAEKKQIVDPSGGPADEKSGGGYGDDEPESDDGLFVGPYRNQDKNVDKEAHNEVQRGGDDGEVDDGDEDEHGEEAGKERELNEEEDFKRLKKKYNSARRMYQKNTEKGTASIQEEVGLMRLKREYEEEVRRRKENAEWEPQKSDDDDDESEDDDNRGSDKELFEDFEDLAGPPERGFDINSDDEDGMLEAYSRAAARRLKTSDNLSDELVGSRSKRTKKRESGKKHVGTAKPRQKANNKASNNRVQDKKAKIQKKDSKGKKGKKDKEGKHLPSTTGSGMLNVGSLLSGNVIRDARDNNKMGPLPVLTDTRRDKALKKLIASIPLEKRNEARADKKSLELAMRDFTSGRAIRVIPGESGGYRISGMDSALKPHQLLGAAFMRRREKDTEGPLGGMCADQMGLGKTVMMVANIIDGMPRKKRDRPKATLIVGSLALVAQWDEEIKKHCKEKKLKVLVHAGKNKIRVDNAAETMARFDIVLTTYGDVRRSYPKVECPIEFQTAEQKQRWWLDFYEEHRGPLHRVEWLRVVLDEAQEIKNHKSHTSIACRGLTARHRWTLSGTPIQNSLEELYPYFKFLRVEHTGSFKIFHQNYIGHDATPSEIGVIRLNLQLSRFMVRRTHADKVMGMPLVVLPKATEQIRWVKFNTVERSIYEIVRSRMIKRINKLSASKKLDSHYSHVLTLLLRLRQLTGHILMVEQVMGDLLEREDHEKIYELAVIERSQVKDGLRAMQLKQIRALLAKGAQDDAKTHPGRTKFPGVDNTMQENYDVDEDGDVDMIPDRDNIGGKHGIHYDFLTYLRKLRTDDQLKEIKNRTKCVSCRDRPQNAQVTSCFHVYCEGCIQNLMEEAIDAGEEGSRCQECGVLFDFSRNCDEMDFNIIKRIHRGVPDSESGGLDEESDSDVEMEKFRRGWMDEDDEKSKERDWIDMEGKNILPSAKTIEIKAQVLNWIAENPMVKIIIFTQFLDMIRILQKVCCAEGWVHTVYHGKVPIEKRQANVRKFESDPSIRVLLASLKSGGIGLNLTMAQKVIVVDPWWNSSVEQQAFCRVFRIGQQHETSLTRFVVENSVDQNMIEMQQRKQDEIDQVMDRKPKTKLEFNDMLKLFGGDVGEDENGQPFIFVENQETPPNPLGDDEDMQDDA